MTEIIIENIVTDAQLSTEFNIQQLAYKIPYSKYDPNEFPGLVLQYDDPKMIVILFPNGRIISTGAKNMEDLNKIHKETFDNIQNCGTPFIEEPVVNIQNIVASSDLGMELDLTSLTNSSLLKNVEYIPDQFPGLIYKMDDLDTTLILFESGKIVCTGSKKFEDVAVSINKIKDKLSSLEVL